MEKLFKQLLESFESIFQKLHPPKWVLGFNYYLLDLKLQFLSRKKSYKINYRWNF